MNNNFSGVKSRNLYKGTLSKRKMIQQGRIKCLRIRAESENGGEILSRWFWFCSFTMKTGPGTSGYVTRGYIELKDPPRCWQSEDFGTSRIGPFVRNSDLKNKEYYHFKKA